MNKTEYANFSLAQIDGVARDVKAKIEASTGGRVFVMQGEMGAGKTTFVKSLCAAFGVTEVVNSPTFSIVNEYETASGESIFHFDFYRVNSPQEAQDIGCEEYFYSGSLCFVEWPDKVRPLLCADCNEIRIVKNDDGTRTLTLVTK